MIVAQDRKKEKKKKKAHKIISEIESTSQSKTFEIVRDGAVPQNADKSLVLGMQKTLNKTQLDADTLAVMSVDFSDESNGISAVPDVTFDFGRASILSAPVPDFSKSGVNVTRKKIVTNDKKKKSKTDTDITKKKKKKKEVAPPLPTTTAALEDSHNKVESSFVKDTCHSNVPLFIYIFYYSGTFCGCI